MYYGIVDSPRNEGKDYFEINEQTGEIFTKVVFDRERQAAYALEVEARDGAPSARPNSHGKPNTSKPDRLGFPSHNRIKCQSFLIILLPIQRVFIRLFAVIEFVLDRAHLFDLFNADVCVLDNRNSDEVPTKFPL